MRIRHYIYIALVALMSACSAQDAYDEPQQVSHMPVLFSAGNTGVALTRATASYMPLDSRFVCSMFFHAGANDTNDSEFGAPVSDVNMTTTWLKISNATGNAVYWNKSYNNENISTDTYGFDASAKCFYWQNRLNHIFLALADNNKLSTDDGTETGTLKLFPDENTQYKNQYMKAYDLTKGDKTSMAEQPDPILAVVTMSPAGATPETNRVKLFFKHQFSQIQVNLKSSQDGSVTIDDHTLIESVELLGVAETGYVAYCIKPDGTVPATTSAPINLDDPKYDATEKDNPYGSCFSLFVRETVPGYLKSFEGIAFGTLQGIRITWKESNDENAVKHVATYKGVKNMTLESGKKYIYNIELRRSLIAQVKAEIVSWDIDQTNYEADGTIDNEN